MAGLSVGQVLWFVPGDPRRHEHGQGAVVVSKIGRKWAALMPERYGRIDIKTWDVDGGGYASPGRCWPSQEAWELERERQHLWRSLRSSIFGRSDAPGGLASDDIARAHEILFPGRQVATPKD